MRRAIRDGVHAAELGTPLVKGVRCQFRARGTNPVWSGRFGLLEDGRDLASAEAERLHAELPRLGWEKILLLTTVVFRG